MSGMAQASKACLMITAMSSAFETLIWTFLQKKIQVVMGLSGSGKSTLIRHINRLIEPTEGQVIVDGEDVLAMSQEDLREFRRHKSSMVFQKFALLPHRTVAQNAAYGLTIQGISEGEAQRTCTTLD